MSNDSELKAFKVKDLRRPEVRASGAVAPEGESLPTDHESTSAGFPTVEGVLDSQTLDEAIDGLKPSYQALEALIASGDIRAKGRAKRAMAAYERVADLLEHLYQTKAALEAPAEEQS